MNPRLRQALAVLALAGAVVATAATQPSPPTTLDAGAQDNAALSSAKPEVTRHARISLTGQVAPRSVTALVRPEAGTTAFDVTVVRDADGAVLAAPAPGASPAVGKHPFTPFASLDGGSVEATYTITIRAANAIAFHPSGSGYTLVATATYDGQVPKGASLTVTIVDANWPPSPIP